MTKLIKKYKNRRLYDIEKSEYITIDTLRQYVNDGIAFKVEDSGSGKDLTNVTLLQILLEIETGSTQFLSTEILRQLICFAQQPMNQKFTEFLEQSFSTFKNPNNNPFLAPWNLFKDKNSG